MKLKIPSIYSQRDPQWSSKFLGFNTALPYTLGNFGCLVTAFSMYIGKRPDETNELIKSVNGFQSGGLFVWSKSPVMGLTQTYISPRYTGPVTTQGLQKIKDSLDSGFPVLCEVDFNPNTSGEEQHYVLVMGYEGDVFWAADPWTGTLINLDVYGGPSRAILQFRVYDKKLDKENTVDVETQISQLREERDRNWNWFVAVCNALKVGANVDTAVAEATKLLTVEQAILDKDRQLSEVQKQASDLQEQLVLKDKAIQDVQTQATTLTVEIGKLQQEVDRLTKQTQDEQDQIQALQDAAKITQSLTGFRKWLFDFLFRR